MSRSSIFSSETLRLESENPAWRGAVKVVAFATAILLAGELSSRVLLARTGRGWEYWHPVAATKFEFIRHRIESAEPIRTLLVGDSTCAADLDPRVFAAALGGAAWNAAWSGNFPLAFEQTTLPLIAQRGLGVDFVVASFIPSGFGGSDEPTASEASLIGSTYVRKQRGARPTGDYFYLARFRTAWPILLESIGGRRQPASVREFGYAPLDGRATAAALAREPVQARDEAVFSERRFAVLRNLMAVVHEKGAVLAVVIPPSLTRSEARLQAAADLRAALKKGPQQGQVWVFDLMRPPFLSKDDFVDLNHLNAGGARKLSAFVAKALAELPPRSPPREHVTP